MFLGTPKRHMMLWCSAIRISSLWRMTCLLLAWLQSILWNIPQPQLHIDNFLGLEAICLLYQFPILRVAKLVLLFVSLLLELLSCLSKFGNCDKTWLFLCYRFRLKANIILVKMLFLPWFLHLDVYLKFLRVFLIAILFLLLLICIWEVAHKFLACTTDCWWFCNSLFGVSFWLH